MHQDAQNFLKRLQVGAGKSHQLDNLAKYICENTTLGGQSFSFKDHEFQIELVNDQSRRMDVQKCSQVGLALALDTSIPTPDGWMTMGDVQVGDTVFDEQGNPCKVEVVSPIYTDHECYRITFDTGETIVADAGHKWYVESDRTFDLSGNYGGRGRPLADSEMFKNGVLTTEAIHTFHKKGALNRFAIPNAKPLNLPSTTLPVDPYFLGLWLGDGNTHACVLTAHKEDAEFYYKELARRGFVCVPSSESGNSVQFLIHFPGQKRPGRYGTPNSVSHELNKLGLLGEKKFVPDIYLWAGEGARRDLLRGLLDTDGSITKNGRCSFYNCNPALVSAVEYLAHSLGYKARTRWRQPSPATLKNGHYINSQQRCAEVSFVAYAENPVFSLPRKRDRLGSQTAGRSTEALRRRIVAVEKVASVPVRCITVNSPSHLFLAGKGMVPTHNSETLVRKMVAFLAVAQGITAIYTLPTTGFARLFTKGRIDTVIENSKVLAGMMQKGNDSSELKQIGSSFLYIRGSYGQNVAISVPAEVVVQDEVDFSNQTTLTTFASRLRHASIDLQDETNPEAPRGYLWRFSTPTVYGFGINRGFEEGSQKFYLIKCRQCALEQAAEFDTHAHLPGYDGDMAQLTANDLNDPNVQVSQARLLCQACHHELDLSPPYRRWVAKYPDRRKTSYRVSPWDLPKYNPLPRVIEQLREYQRKADWANFVLGIPYEDAQSSFMESMIDACTLVTPVSPLQGANGCVAGIDVGKTSWFFVGKPVASGLDIIYMEQIQATGENAIYDRALELILGFGVYKVVIDAMPDFTTALTIINRLPKGVAYACYYTRQDKRQLTNLTVKDEESVIDANRTKTLDDLAKKVNGGMIRWPKMREMEIVKAHFSAMKRIESITDEGEKVARWISTKDDHYAHAANYLNMAYAMASQGLGRIILPLGPNLGGARIGVKGEEAPGNRLLLAERTLHGRLKE